MFDEINNFAENVIEIIGTSQIQNFKDPKLLGGRWVSANKGDHTNPKVRCRFVATEVNHEDNPQYFAATPPLDAIRLLLNKFSKGPPAMRGSNWDSLT